LETTETICKSSQQIDKELNPMTRKAKKTKPIPASLVWFEIPADNVERAKGFYNKLFGWKIKKLPVPMEKPYWLIETGGGDQTPDGGLMERQSPHHSITNYISVASVDRAAAKVQKLGGKICMPKTAVPGMGYFVVCQDTESNMFALWEREPSAK
jgi:predicted enzyme related to lactoylglutathione lyase